MCVVGLIRCLCVVWCSQIMAELLSWAAGYVQLRGGGVTTVEAVAVAVLEERELGSIEGLIYEELDEMGRIVKGTNTLKHETFYCCVQVSRKGDPLLFVCSSFSSDVLYFIF